MPPGFSQAGGNYVDFIGDKLSPGDKTREYTIIGVFTTFSEQNEFLVLRGTQYSRELDKFIYKGNLLINTVREHSNAARTFAINSSITCSGYTFTDGQIIGASGSTNVVISIESGCAVAYWQGGVANGTRVNIDWLPLLTGKTIPDNILTSCVKWDGQVLDCSGCTTPSAPTISKTSGTTVCAASSQSVTLTAAGCSGTVTWFRGATEVGTGSTFTTSIAGTYTAKCTMSACVSASSNSIVVTETSGCGSSGGTSCVVNKVRLGFRLPGDCCMDRLVGAKIQGSTNNSTWTDLYTISANGTGNWQEFTFSNTTAYSYVRFVASSTGWGELTELEFYNGTTKLTGTPFGTAGNNSNDGYEKAFDGNISTQWHGSTVGSVNHAGLQLTNCEPSECTAPSAPTISKTSGTTVCAASSQSVTLTAEGCSGTVTWFRGTTEVGTGSTFTTSTAGTYTAKCTVSNCVSASSNSIVVTEASGCGATGDLLGTYSQTIGNREYTFNKTPEFTLQFNTNGTISDVTPGMSYSGGINRLNGKNVFYMIGYSVFENSDGSYNRLNEVYLPDGIYTVRQFVCDPGVAPDLTAFKTKLTGWNNGVNASNSTLSEIFLSIKTLGEPQGLSIKPDWLKATRNLRHQTHGTVKDWTLYDKHFAVAYQNYGSSAAPYQSLGLNTEIDLNNPSNQPNTWITARWHSNSASETELYDAGKHYIERSGNSKRFVLTDQIPEILNQYDPSIESKMYQFYKGAYDQLEQSNGVTDKRQTGLYGPYYDDDFRGTLTPLILSKNRTTYIESLTTNLYDRYDPSNEVWTGLASYYSENSINVRNINHGMYLSNDTHYLPYRLLYINERIKLGTKQYGGQDRESNWIVYSWPSIEPLVNNNDVRNGIEYASRGEIIPFPNGEIHSQNNLEIPAPWDEYLTLGFWSAIVSNGLILWSSPNSRFGEDITKFDWLGTEQMTNSPQPVFWTPTGGAKSDYISNNNGAPEQNPTGLKNRLWSSPQDAAMAGIDAAWKIRDRISTLSHISYSSSKGAFTAVPGNTGLHLNGFGPLNIGMYVVKDAFDAKKGVALIGNGTGGNVIIYYNGFLSPHEYEDNVTINGVNLGRVYGRQTIVKEL